MSTRIGARDMCSKLRRHRKWEFDSGSYAPTNIGVSGISISKIIQYIKEKSSRKLLQKLEPLRKRYRGQHLWVKGYFAVMVVNINTEDVQWYMENQEVHHKQDDFRISEF